MRLTDRFDGSAAPFEGDRTLEIRSLPANAKVSKAIVTLTPAVARGGTLFEETIVPGGDARVSRGATKFGGTGFVEVDFHQRRTLRSLQGNDALGAKLQVEMGGIYLQLNGVGAIKASSDQGEFSVPPDGRLPGLTVSKFKLTRDSGSPPNSVDLTSVTVASVPLNVTARIGNLPPFFGHIGEMSQEQVSPDFAASLQAFLAEAPVENGFCVVPLVLHSDSIARISVTLAIDYVVESPVLPAGVGEPLLPFDLSGQATTENKLLTFEVPAQSRIAHRGIQGRVTGRFDETRVLYPPQLPLVPVKVSGRTERISSDSSFAQPINLGLPLVATAVDLLLAVQSRGALQLDLHDDLDGKPGSTSLLPAPIRFEPAAPAGGQPSGQSDFTAKWLSVPLPAEFKFSEGTRYWLVLHSLEGEADWRVEPGPSPPASQPGPGLQCTQDGALSWREAVPRETGQPFGGLFRLRGRTTPYRMPIEMRIGPPDPASEVPSQRVSLNRFAASGRVDFTLDFDDLSQAANAYLDSTASVSPATGEHLVNGDFRRWLAIGHQPNEPLHINLDPFVPAALAVAPNGSRAYLADGRRSTAGIPGGLLKVIDLACGRLLEEKTIILGNVQPRALVLSPDGSRAYVGGAGGLVLVDLTTGAPLGDPFSTGVIVSLAISPDGALLYATIFSNNENALKIIDCATLETFLLGGQSGAQKVALGTIPLNFFTSGAFVAASPNGSYLYLAHTGGEEFQILDLASFKAAGSEILLGGNAAAIGLSPDGKCALVPIVADTPAVAVVNLDSRTVTSIPLNAEPVAIGVHGTNAYVAMANGTVGLIDLKRSTLQDETLALGSGADPVGLAVTAQGDRIIVANAGNAASPPTKSSVTLIELGRASPHEWNVITGEVSRHCLPGFPQPVLVLGSIEQNRENDMPAHATAAISQLVPAVPSGRYELSFRALATTAGAFAEVIWRGQNCEAFPGERVPIQTLMDRPSAFAAALRNAQPLLAAHRKQLLAPEGARQAEIRFIAAEGAAAAIAEASFSGASERLANADFSLREGNGLAAWTLLPGAAAGATLLAATEGIRVQNAGNRPVELVQKVSAEALQFFTLEFEGRVERSSAEAAPQVELRWLRDGAPAGEPTTLHISADGLALTAAHGRSPDVTEAEIRLAVPNEVTLEVKRISLRFTEAIPLTLSFMAETLGEVAVADLRVAFEKVPPGQPPLPVNGLCEPNPVPGGASSESCDGEATFCPCCQSEQPLDQVSRMETEAGRAVRVGQCRSCGAQVPRFGGKPEPGAAPFTLKRGLGARPPVLRASAPRPSLNEPDAAARVSDAAERISPAEALMSIDLIGPKRAERLMAQGIDTPAKLAEISAEEIVELLKPGVSRQQAEQMRTEARSPTS
jgi:DNA-binding beta-propeller fold protein YncE